MKADDLESPLRLNQLHFKIKLESTKVGDKVFVTERMHRVQTKAFRDADGWVALSPSTITKRYKHAVKYVSLTTANDKHRSSIHIPVIQ